MTLLSSLFEIERFQNQGEQEQVEDDTEEGNITCYCGNVKCVIEMKVYRYVGQRQ